MVRRFSDEDVERSNNLPEPGWHVAIVAKCEERRSQGGRSYYRVHLEDPKTRRRIVQDICMLEGGYLREGLEKLAMLGGAHRDEATGAWEVLDASDVRGECVRVHVHHETYESPNGPKLRTSVTASEGMHGYESVATEAGAAPF